MNKLLLFCFLLAVFLYCNSCDGLTPDQEIVSLALANESGATGCTVAGLGSQIRAGYTGITTSDSTVSWVKQADLYYSVQQIAGAQVGTRVVFSRDVSPSIYKDSSCPLELDGGVLAKDGTDYVKSGGNFTFLKSGSYLFYLYQMQDPSSSPLSVKTDGTPVQTGTSDEDLDAILNGGSPSFKFSCNAPAPATCQNYYVISSITSCLAGGSKQTAKCTENGSVVGSCKASTSGVGTVITLYYSPTFNATNAKSACDSLSGTFVSGSTVQTP